MRGSVLGIVLLAQVLGSFTALDGADLILNEYNAVRAGRWLECDGLNCCCLQPVCEGGALPGGLCFADADCPASFRCTPDNGATFTEDLCNPTNGHADCTAIDEAWTCEEQIPGGTCLCNPPCRGDVFFGRVQGNGGNWIELVVTRNHLDVRGWRLVWTEDPSDTGTLTLTDDPFWGDVRAGTILTFTELDSAVGGLDTDVSSNPASGDWWININTLSSSGVPQTQYVTTVTNVPGDGPGNFSVGNDNWKLTIFDRDSNIVFGPCGEGVPLTGTAVSSREVFKLEQDPSNQIVCASAEYHAGTSSTFGHPNIWSGGDINQDFTCLRCNDGVFCNGEEPCGANGICQAGVAPCLDLGHCDEDANRCLQCLDAGECSDGDSCTTDLCDSGTCRFTPIPGCGGPPSPPSDGDLDGVTDALDACPETDPGESVDAEGCACGQRDQDQDGISDCDDECAGTLSRQSVDASGCSCDQRDDDGDGVNNCDDACPDTVDGEPADARGCPCGEAGADTDVDEDGVIDCNDQCAETPPGEDVDDRGCSCLQRDPERDDDGDGVQDCIDRCPESALGEAVDEAGCGAAEEPPAGLPVGPTPGSDGEVPDSGSNEDDEPAATDPRNRPCLCGILGVCNLGVMTLGLIAFRGRRPMCGSAHHWKR